MSYHKPDAHCGSWRQSDICGEHYRHTAGNASVVEQTKRFIFRHRHHKQPAFGLPALQKYLYHVAQHNGFTNGQTSPSTYHAGFCVCGARRQEDQRNGFHSESEDILAIPCPDIFDGHAFLPRIVISIRSDLLLSVEYLTALVWNSDHWWKSPYLWYLRGHVRLTYSPAMQVSFCWTSSSLKHCFTAWQFKRSTGSFLQKPYWSLDLKCSFGSNDTGDMTEFIAAWSRSL